MGGACLDGDNDRLSILEMKKKEGDVLVFLMADRLDG